MELGRGRPKKHELVVSAAQKVELAGLARQSRKARSVAFRARIILECAGGLSNAAVAAKLHTSGLTVGLWRDRFIAQGIAGLGGEPRPGAPREHFTPTHASWLNQVERWFALLTQRQIKRGSHRSVPELEAAIREFIAVHNQQPKPFRWTKSADQILASIARFASSTLAAHRPKTYTRNQ